LQVFILGLCVLAGITITTHQNDSFIIQKMGEPWSSLWGVSLVLGAGIALLGGFWKNRITGMLIERAGILLLGLASFIWPVIVISIVGYDGLFSAATTLTFSITCGFQWKYINQHMKNIFLAIEEEQERQKDA
jgi:hypothetical protein